MTPINREQIGSAIFQSKYSMSKVEMITPTLPNVSASTCRKTPTMWEAWNEQILLQLKEDKIRRPYLLFYYTECICQLE